MIIEKKSKPLPNQHLLKIILGMLKLLSFSMIDRIGNFAGTIMCWGLKKRKKIGLANLRIVFPEKTDQERLKIFKKCWQNICKDLLEVGKYSITPTSKLKERISIVGLENFEQAIKENKGIILLSAHFGIFPVLLGTLVREGYQVATIYRDMHNKILGRVIPDLQKITGIKSILDKPRHRCVAMSLGWLKKGGILFIQIDQNPSRQAGVPVKFFDRKLPTFRGPVILSMRTGACIIPAFIIRKDNDHHRIIIEKPYKMDLTKDNDQDIQSNLEALNKITEEYIKRDPSLWWWIHRRFRKEIL